MGPHDERIALFTTLRFVAQRVPVVTETSALRRPGLVIRRTRYLGVIVDERVLTKVFTARERRGRLQALLLLRGTLHFGSSRPLGIGEALLLHHHHEAVLRFEDSDFSTLPLCGMASNDWLAGAVNVLDNNPGDGNPPWDLGARQGVFVTAAGAAGRTISSSPGAPGRGAHAPSCRRMTRGR